MITAEDKKQIEKIVEETIKKELPKILGRSNVQVRDYFNKNII